MDNVIEFSLCKRDEGASILYDVDNKSLSIILDNRDNNDEDAGVKISTEFTLCKGKDNIKVAVDELLQNKYIQHPELSSPMYILEYTFKDSNLTFGFEMCDEEWYENGLKKKIVVSFVPFIKNEYFTVYANLQYYPGNPMEKFKEFLIRVKESL